jgi:type IV pilus assembly protein PilB
MTLSPSRPVPQPSSAEQQRLELELLLGEPVLTQTQLRPDLIGDLVLSLERWRQLAACPHRATPGGPALHRHPQPLERRPETRPGP